MPKRKALSYDRTIPINRGLDHLDDFGLAYLDKKQQIDFMEIIEDRHSLKSTIIASQIPFDKWFEIIGEATIADAIMDRLIHSAYKINLSGESLRKKQ